MCVPPEEEPLFRNKEFSLARCSNRYAAGRDGLNLFTALVVDYCPRRFRATVICLQTEFLKKCPVNIALHHSASPYFAHGARTIKLM